MAPSRSETLRDLFRPLPWALPAALLVTFPGLASSGVPALWGVLLVAGWATVVTAFARRLGASPAAATVAGILAMAHPALHLALASGTLSRAVVPALAVGLAGVVRLGPKDAESLPGLGKREWAAMLLCAIAAAIDVAAAFSPVILWIFDLAYDPGSFRTVAARWKRIGWGYAAVTLPAWWAVSGAAPMFGPGGFKGAACVSLLIPPREGTITAVSILLPIAALWASAYIRQRHQRPRPFGIAVGAALATVLLGVLPGAVMDGTTPPVLASLGAVWGMAAGFACLRDRVLASDVVRPTPMEPLPAVPGLRDVVTAARGAPDAPAPTRVPVVVSPTGAATAVETAVAAAVAGVVSELRAVRPPGNDDDPALLWERLTGHMDGPRAVPLPDFAAGDPMADLGPGTAPVAILGPATPALVAAIAGSGHPVVMVGRGRARTLRAARDFPQAASVSVVRHDAAATLPFQDGALAGIVALLDLDGRSPANVLAMLTAWRRAVAPDGRLHVVFTDAACPTNVEALRDGRIVVQSEDVLLACATAAGWAPTGCEDLGNGRIALRFGAPA